MVFACRSARLTSISEGDIYVINPDTCNECEDKDEGPHCVAVCPVECIVKAE